MPTSHNVSNGSVVHCRRAPYDVYIGRPSPWGNPFEIGKDGTREQVIERYRQWVMTERQDLYWRARKELPGKTLGCWCAPQKCHGDFLLAIARGEVPPPA